MGQLHKRLVQSLEQAPQKHNAQLDYLTQSNMKNGLCFDIQKAGNTATVGFDRL
jgi:hypothetical protein